jgi:hypothetical protein
VLNVYFKMVVWKKGRVHRKIEPDDGSTLTEKIAQDPLVAALASDEPSTENSKSNKAQSNDDRVPKEVIRHVFEKKSPPPSPTRTAVPAPSPMFAFDAPAEEEREPLRDVVGGAEPRDFFGTMQLNNNTSPLGDSVEVMPELLPHAVMAEETTKPTMFSTTRDFALVKLTPCKLTGIFSTIKKSKEVARSDLIAYVRVTSDVITDSSKTVKSIPFTLTANTGPRVSTWSKNEKKSTLFFAMPPQSKLEDGVDASDKQMLRFDVGLIENGKEVIPLGSASIPVTSACFNTTESRLQGMRITPYQKKKKGLFHRKKKAGNELRYELAPNALLVAKFAIEGNTETPPPPCSPEATAAALASSPSLLDRSLSFQQSMAQTLATEVSSMPQSILACMACGLCFNGARQCGPQQEEDVKEVTLNEGDASLEAVAEVPANIESYKALSAEVEGVGKATIDTTSDMKQLDDTNTESTNAVVEEPTNGCLFTWFGEEDVDNIVPIEVDYATITNDPSEGILESVHHHSRDGNQCFGRPKAVASILEESVSNEELIDDSDALQAAKESRNATVMEKVLAGQATPRAANVSRSKASSNINTNTSTVVAGIGAAPTESAPNSITAKGSQSEGRTTAENDEYSESTFERDAVTVGESVTYASGTTMTSAERGGWFRMFNFGLANSTYSTEDDGADGGSVHWTGSNYTAETGSYDTDAPQNTTKQGGARLTRPNERVSLSSSKIKKLAIALKVSPSILMDEIENIEDEDTIQ